jgi:hypothetical protein
VNEKNYKVPRESLHLSKSPNTPTKSENTAYEVKEYSDYITNKKNCRSEELKEYD